MRIDWDRESGDWQVWSESGVMLDKAHHVVISGVCELITEGQRHHGWAVTAGEINRRGDTLFITKE